MFCIDAVFTVAYMLSRVVSRHFFKQVTTVELRYDSKRGRRHLGVLSSFTGTNRLVILFISQTKAVRTQALLATILFRPDIAL